MKHLVSFSLLAQQTKFLRPSTKITAQDDIPLLGIVICALHNPETDFVVHSSCADVLIKAAGSRVGKKSRQRGQILSLPANILRACTQFAGVIVFAACCQRASKCNPSIFHANEYKKEHCTYMHTTFSLSASYFSICEQN